MYAGRIYTVTWDAATAISAQIDVFELTPADDRPLFVPELKMWQTSDLGDSAEEVIGVQWIRGFTTSGSGGGTSVVGKKYAGDSNAGFSHECRNTTLANTGTTETIEADGWNVRIPYIWTPSAEDRLFVSQAETRLVCRLMAAPADAITMFAAVKVEELG